MKKFTKLMAAVMLMTAMVFAVGCKKDKNDDSGGGGGDTHEYVDLELPSGLLWATCNLGADKPEAAGAYVAWAETETKESYSWTNYKYCNKSMFALTKYCNSADCGNEGFTDSLMVLLPEDDAAEVHWGNGWRTPSKEDWLELYANTTYSWTTQRGAKGALFTAPNGKTLFFPAVGYCMDGDYYYYGSEGYYWSTALVETRPYDVWAPNFTEDGIHLTSPRCVGQCVRPVRSRSEK
jgi:hypothetical protein